MKTKKRTYTWAVTINYSYYHGGRGEVVSRHTSYELAAAALRRSIDSDRYPDRGSKKPRLRLEEISE